MGATKYEVYTEQQIQKAKFFKAFGHPARIAVLENLIKASGEDTGIQELFDGIQLAQSTKSCHLKQLVDAGLVKTKLETKDRKSCLRYRINKPAIELVQKFLDFIYENIDLEANEKHAETERFYSDFRTGIDWNVHFKT